MNDPSFGIWDVSTEGDCEGRSTLNLGIYEGHFDEIALHLANKACYRLTIVPYVPPFINKGPYLPTKRSVTVCTGYNSNAPQVTYLCKNRPVTVKGDMITTSNEDALKYNNLMQKKFADLSDEDVLFLVKMKKEYGK